eukprot:gene23941-biopygen23865
MSLSGHGSRPAPREPEHEVVSRAEPKRWSGGGTTPNWHVLAALAQRAKPAHPHAQRRDVAQGREGHPNLAHTEVTPWLPRLTLLHTASTSSSTNSAITFFTLYKAYGNKEVYLVLAK